MDFLMLINDSTTKTSTKKTHDNYKYNGRNHNIYNYVYALSMHAMLILMMYEKQLQCVIFHITCNNHDWSVFFRFH